MRLICPNCDAHYEVDAALIPPAGRDVQCSDCGHVWFQDGVGEIIIPAPIPVDTSQEQTEVREINAPVDLPAQDDTDLDEEGETLRPLAQRSLDETLLSVLREEAEREAAARARDSGGLVEVQPDLGLSEAETTPRRRIIVRAPLAHAQPVNVAEAEDSADLTSEPDPEVVAPRPSRRELLPDIEQINSTLRASDEPRRAGEAEVQLPEPLQKRRKGFRVGFLSVLLIAALAVSLYAGATIIKTALPALGPWLDSYVAQVDALRHELDRLLHSLLLKLEQSSGS